ncbi:TFIIA-domain-containing protein [Ramicandelaber brevisporus]|nr:TFIIA-domain-containing protein [Ramicandelaber brevisporus]
MTSQTTLSIYQMVINEVIEASARDFEENGVEEEVLAELKRLWEVNLASSQEQAAAEVEAMARNAANSTSAAGASGAGRGGVGVGDVDDEGDVDALFGDTVGVDGPDAAGGLGGPEEFSSNEVPGPESWSMGSAPMFNQTSNTGVTAHGYSSGYSNPSDRLPSPRTAAPLPGIHRPPTTAANSSGGSGGILPPISALAGGAARSSGNLPGPLQHQPPSAAPLSAYGMNAAAAVQQKGVPPASPPHQSYKQISLPSVSSLTANARVGGQQQQQQQQQPSTPTQTSYQYNNISYQQQQQQQQQQQPSNYQSHIPQHDGPSAGSADDDADADADAGASAAPVTSNEDDLLGSDLDDPSDTEDVQEADQQRVDHGNTTLCQHEKVGRTKNRWKIVLRDGVINANGRDFLFNRANCEFEW